MAVNPYPIDPTPNEHGFYNNLNPNAQFEYEDAHDPKNMYDTAHLRYEFTTSIAYHKAKQLFESGPQSDIWLTKLEQIVASLSLPEGNEITDIGNFFSNTYANRYTEALNNAFVSLNNLTNDWSKWFNELPAEQRSQFESAGLNIALDGGSMLSGSSVAPTGISPSQPFTEQQNQSFDNVVNFATATTGGLLDFIGSVQNVFKLGQSARQLDIAEDTTLSSINQQRLSLGLNPLQKLSDVGSKKTISKDELSNYAIKSSNEQEAGAKNSRVALETEVNPIYNAVDDAARLNVGPYNEILAKIGNIHLATKLYNDIYQNELTIFNKEQQKIKNQVLSQFGGQLALGEAETALEEQSAKKAEFKRSAKLDELGETLINYKKSVLSDWINKANSNSPDSFIYSSLLMKSGLSLSDYMGPADVGLEYISKGSNILDDVLGILNPLKWLKP